MATAAIFSALSRKHSTQALTVACRSSHNAIPNCRADISLCERDICPLRPLREVYCYRAASGVRIGLGHGHKKCDQVAGRARKTSHQYGVSVSLEVLVALPGH
jgi:hypothetical protein